MSKIYCIGELLIDMVCIDGKGLKNGDKFEKKAGGAPANVACTISKMGKRASFIGQIGKDYFGEYLGEVLDEYSIDKSLCTYGGNTTIALVGIDESGERNFNFIRACDGDYKYNNIISNYFTNEDILHFGSATAFLGGELKETYFKLLDLAIRSNMFISFDPNYRDSLISEELLQQFVENCIHFISKSDFVKMSEEEVLLITKESNIELAIKKIHSLGAKIVTVTLGSKGTILSYNNEISIVNSIKINQVDSTGAGDSFVGAMLSFISELKHRNYSYYELKKICKKANIVGAITCTKYGAMDSIPNLEEVNKLI